MIKINYRARIKILMDRLFKFENDLSQSEIKKNEITALFDSKYPALRCKTKLKLGLK